MAKQKSQECFILINSEGHPVKHKGMFYVFKSKWRAIVATGKTTQQVKKLTIEL
jgi:hypothetical protein